MSVLSILSVVVAALVGSLVVGLVGGVLFLVWKVLRLAAGIVRHSLRFVRHELVDVVHTLAAAVTSLTMVPLAAANAVILRLGAARHYGRAILDEWKSVGVGLWRVALGNPLRALGLGRVADRMEHVLPDVMERAPRARGRRATFEGYDVVGTLPSGGSGAQLFIARPRAATVRRFHQAGRPLPKEVVIKSFALVTGSTLPQIVRESRALEAASRLGLVCEHQLTDDHFYYVMPYVKGQELDRVGQQLHARSGAAGLGGDELALVLGYTMDVLRNLQRFHSGGLWHKDVKPANILISAGQAHLVDFGLVTPLASAMTLTTHGTEYYRDPEMVRLALQGVKVHEVDGVRFDIYSAGAVLYSLIENSFPAHGSLSRITKRCPEALRWIVQRSMAELSARYGDAEEMRADLEVLASAADPDALRPADLPSFGRSQMPMPDRAVSHPEPAPLRPVAPVMGGPRSTFETLPRPRRRRRVRAVAGLAGLFLGLSAFSAALRHERGRAHASVVTVIPSPVPRPVRLASQPAGDTWLQNLSEHDRRTIELARLVTDGVALEDGQERAPRTAAPLGRAPELTPALRESKDPGAPAPRILVLDDLTSGVDGNVVEELREKLELRGYSILGTAPDAEGEVDTIASARHAFGLGRADEPETQAALQRFLDGRSDLDALIVVSREAPEGEHLFRVLVRDEAASAVQD
jgi:serine/threonine protein kinase